jgi:hypothetical protein
VRLGNLISPQDLSQLPSSNELGLMEVSTFDPRLPKVFGPGQDAEAEPAISGWRMPVDRIFA